jgi:hypothetical protein
MSTTPEHLANAARALGGQAIPLIDGCVSRAVAVRNRIVHGRDDEIDDREVAASVDAGLRLLRLLDAIPREGYEVATRLLPVYSDPGATEAYEGVLGVVLRSFDVRGEPTEYHIYPTRRSYNPRERVGWQWSFDATWGEAFWRDPFDGDQVKLAWSESAEFVGERLIRQPNAPDSQADRP